MKRLAVLTAITAAVLALSGCLSPAAQQAPDSAVVRCTVLTGQGAGTSFETSKADAIHTYSADTSNDLYCDLSQP